MAALYPDAPIYTSLYDAEHTFAEFADRSIITSHLQGRVNPQTFRRAVLRFPKAFRSFDLRDADRVLVSSSAFAHHIRHPRSLVYCHTPPRFLYDTGAYIRPPALAPLAWLAFTPLRVRDRAGRPAQCGVRRQLERDCGPDRRCVRAAGARRVPASRDAPPSR